MEHREVQQIAKDTVAYLKTVIAPGMRLREVRRLCEAYMLSHGCESFWYWDVGAFVFAGDETAVSVSGREYRTSDRLIKPDDIVTVDLSPQHGDIWGDYARTIVLEDGKVADSTDRIRNSEWRRGLQLEDMLHRELLAFAMPQTTFEMLWQHFNGVIAAHGFQNLDFLGNLGHSIVTRKEDRIYIEKGNSAPLSAAGYFTFEPHIGLPGSVYGCKKENIYYFQGGQLTEL